MATSSRNGHIRKLTALEGQRVLDAQARRYLHMSGREFVRRWKAGEFKGRADRPEVMRVAMLLPLGR